MIKILLMDWVFSHLSPHLIKWVDPVKKADFEKHLVLINLVFIILNHFGMVVLIRFYLPLRFGKCSMEMPSYDKVYDKVLLQIGDVSQVEQDFYNFQKISLGCFQEIKIFYASYIIINFLVSIVRVLYTRVKVRRLKKQQGEVKAQLRAAAEQKSKIHKNGLKKRLNLASSNLAMSKMTNASLLASKQESSEISMKGIKLSQLVSKHEVPKLNESSMLRKVIPKLAQKQSKAFDYDMYKQYYLLNQFIEVEVYLENLDQSDDLDSTIRNFNEVFVMYMALSMFGMLFPASYFLYYFVLIMEIYIDRETYLFVTRRPSPKEMNSIGFFKYFLVICPSLSIIILSYYLSFSLVRITLNINYIYMSFLLVFVCGLLIFQLVYQINPKGSEKMKHLIERQKYIGGWRRAANRQRRS